MGIRYTLFVMIQLLLPLQNYAQSAESASIPRELWSAAFSGRFDSTSANAFEEIVDSYWSNRRDSVVPNTRRAEEFVREWREHSSDPVSLMKLERCLGVLYKFSNDPTKSVQHLFAALALAEKTSTFDYAASITMEIGLMYYLQANWERAIVFFTRAKAYFERLGRVSSVNTQEYLIALSLNNSERYQEALPIFRKIFAFSVQRRDTNRIQEMGSGFADALRGVGKLDSAEALYRSIARLTEQRGTTRPPFLVVVHSGLAKVFFAKGNDEEAESHALLALKYSTPFQYFIPALEAERILYLVYKNRGDHKRALEYFERYSHDHDSLQNKEYTANMNVSQALFEYQHKEDAIVSEEAKKRQVMIVVAALASLLVVVVFFFYRSLSKQKSKTEALLENILPRETIGELKQLGVVTPRIHHNVSIMFCDVKDFTTHAQDMGPEELVALLDAYFRRFDEIVSTHGLEKIKTIGDAYMLTGGLHDQIGTHAERCVRAAIDMIQAVQDMAPQLEQQFSRSFTFRIGIHSGSVISGVVGRDKYAYDVWGDAVNTASRIEQHSEVGMINLSGSTFELVKEIFPCTYRGKISAKNKGEVDMYFVQT